jgi:hypothetical protein
MAVETSFSASANTAATISVANTTAKTKKVRWISWSYNGDPTGGRIAVAFDGANQHDKDITSGGPSGTVRFDPPLEGTGTVLVTLAAGGSGVTGKVSAFVDD